MSSPLLTASPTAPPSAPSSTKQPAFDDACFKTPLPFNRKPRRGRGATSTTGGTRPNGYHSSGSTRGGRVGRPSGALSLPMYASVESTNEAKEVVHCDGEKPSTSTNTIKEEAVENNSNPGPSPKPSESSTNKLPFVEEMIFDEYSLLLFTHLSDAQLFERELETVRAREELEKKRIAAEKAARIEKLKKKIRARKVDEFQQYFHLGTFSFPNLEVNYFVRIGGVESPLLKIQQLSPRVSVPAYRHSRLIEKAARLQRKRLRSQKREKLRRERRSQRSALKKTIREAKALQKAAGATGRVVVVDKELKKQWKALQAADSRRREEKARKRVEHEVRKEARRAKRDKKRGRKRRNDPNKATAAKKGKDTAAAGGGLGGPVSSTTASLLGTLLAVPDM
uniref:Ribosomal RNA-processing protein 14/surfeit locus protein 6 C-terminal domain-containing protein n=1 Tax=Angiostrongylus cantonensis TaxID=6313 RepID=A0A158P5Z4_ANGCA